MPFYIRVTSLITPVHCITQTEEPYFYNKPYFWTGAYFVASCGGVTVEQLKKYVENQNSPKVETLPR
ncbi:MAG: hypothetical protein EWV83_00955 [Microcystis sp. M_OC_Ca_00000000_S217Cul]|nr:MAG: hypothetical protein EWV83_00955 [Microcystis sp. M_OC_Ca_00000000_S217Cul]